MNQGNTGSSDHDDANTPARRQSPRVKVDASVRFARDLDHQSGDAIDIGLGGMCIGTSKSLAVGENTVVMLRIASSQPVPFSGVVRWTNPRAFGIKFGPLSALQLRTIVEVLKRARVL